MTAVHKTAIRTVLPILLAAGAHLAYGGSTAGASAPTASAAAVPPSSGTAQRPVATAAPSAKLKMYSLLDQLQSGGAPTAAPVLVIPAGGMTPETYDRIVEDLSIMSRIIEKSLANVPEVVMYNDHYRAHHVMPMGLDPGASPSLWSSDERPRSVYIGDYGVLFSLAVEFPLVPPAAAEPNRAVDETDRTWAQTRQELLDPQAARRQAATPKKAYHADAVESLRTTLIGLLKHAANIRALGPEDWVTILVQGPAATGPRPASESTPALPLFLPSAPGKGRTLLTLRARKADLGPFAKGQLDEAQFQQRVQITTY